MGALPPVRRLRTWWCARAAARALAAALATALTTGGAFVTACAPIRPTPTPAPSPVAVNAPIPVPEKPVPVDPLAEPWIVGVPTTTVTHEIAVTTEVRAAATTAALATGRPDSLHTTLLVRWDSSGRATARAGSLTSYRVSAAVPAGAPSGPVSGAPPAWLTMPLAIVAALEADRQMVRVTTPRESSCGVDAAAAQMAREVLLAPPSRLARGVSWVDSLRTTVCRDSIPLTLTSTRRYVVEDARVQDGRAVVVIRRRSTTTLSGAGTQFGEPVTITGEGQGELLFGLRLDDGQMTDGNGVSTLTLSLTGRRKSQVVTQNARLEIRRR
ncbi:MAG: hypothetical protein RLZZ63_452 [Gemmatimonadota bacterium]|jgi:hypothetical protein